MKEWMMRAFGRKSAIAFFTLVFTVSVPFLKHLTTDDDYTALLPRGDVSARYYERYLEEFPSDAGNIVVATGNALCTEEGWKRLTLLSDDLERLSGVDRVISLTNANYIAGRGNTVEVKNFPDVSADAQKRCELAVAYVPYKNLLINAEATAVAIYIVAEKKTDALTVSDGVKAVLEKHRSAFRRGFCDGVSSDCNGGDLLQSGELNVSAELSRATDRASMILPIVVFIMMAVVWIQTRSVLVGILAGATGISTTALTFALMVIVGIPQNPVNVLMVNLLIPLGAAFTIHAFGYAKRGGNMFFGWLPASALRPFAFAVITTMIGFGTTGISGIPAVRQFGFLGTFGILACLFVTITLTFPVLAFRKKDDEDKIPNDGNRHLFMLTGRQTIVLIAILTAVSALGIGKLKVNYGPIDYLKENNPVHLQFDRVKEIFGTYVIPLTVFDNIHQEIAVEPKVQNTVHAFVEKQKILIPGLRASNFYDQLRQLSLAFSADEDMPEEFPKKKEGVSQFLLLFEDDDIEPYISHDRTSLTVLLQTPFRNSDDFSKFDRAVKSFAQENRIDAVLTGRVAQFFRAGIQIAKENMRSLATGIMLVFVTFVVLTRSIKLAAFAIVVNALPVLGSLALLGIFEIDLDIGSSIVSAIALGLVVDDTGHFLAQYTHHRKSGFLPEQAVKKTIQELAFPIVTSTVAVVAGFLAMNMADLIPYHTFSRLLSVTMLYALFGDLILLPALLAHFDRPWLPELAKIFRFLRRETL